MIIKSYQPQAESRRVNISAMVFQETYDAIIKEAEKKGWTRSAVIADLLQTAIEEKTMKEVQ